MIVRNVLKIFAEIALLTETLPYSAKLNNNRLIGVNRHQPFFNKFAVVWSF